MPSVNELKGYIVSLSLTGSVTPQFSSCWTEMRSFNETRAGLTNVEYRIQHGLFVESARDDAVLHALQEKYDWILQVDADATFPADTLLRLLNRAYVEFPNAGVMGTYSQLKAEPHFPTIDTGSGTWEEHYPGEGVLQVIRTGCHCFLMKTSVIRKIGGGPWFRTRLAQQPIRAFREVDSFARQRLSGKNPLSDHPEWETLLQDAETSTTQRESVVGEDSAFFDRCRAHNVNVMVDTDLVTGHVSQHVIQPVMFRDKIRESRKMQRAMLGVG